MIRESNIVAEHRIADGALLLLIGNACVDAAVVAAVVETHLLGYAAGLLVIIICIEKKERKLKPNIANSLRQLGYGEAVGVWNKAIRMFSRCVSGQNNGRGEGDEAFHLSLSAGHQHK